MNLDHPNLKAAPRDVRIAAARALLFHRWIDLMEDRMDTGVDRVRAVAAVAATATAGGGHADASGADGRGIQ
jgi:hypothetical protein